MLNIYKDFYNSIVKRTLFWMPVLLTGICAYGFSIMNRTVFIDDLRRDYYITNEKTMIAGGRWGQWFYIKLFGDTDLVPFYDRFLALLFLIAAAVTFCAILYVVCGRRHILVYTFTACEFVAYPLIIELWEFTGADWMACLNMAIGNVVLLDLLMLYRSRERAGLWRHVILTSLAMSLVFSSYESGVFYYFAVALMVSYLMIAMHRGGFAAHVRQVLFLLVPYPLAVVLRVVVGKILIVILQPTAGGSGDTSIKWGSNSVVGVLISTAWNYIAHALIYLPLTIFVCALLIYGIYTIVRSVREHNPLLLLIGFGVLISLFSQEILQCSVMPYRTAQTLTAFVALVAYLIVTAVEDRRWTRNVVYVILAWLCLIQCAFSNKMLGLDNLRSENEINILSQIGYEIITEYGEDVSVLTVGSYDNSDYVNGMIYADESKGTGRLFAALYDLLRGDNYDPEYNKIGQRLAYPAIEWSFTREDTMQRYFSYCGYDIHVIDRNTEEGQRVYDMAEQIGEDMSRYEIREWDGYIIVKF